jgi:hypothetical protein
MTASRHALFGVACAVVLALVGCGSTSPADDVPTCDEYCDLIMDNCVESTAQYPDLASCVAACPSFATGELEDKAGNTIGCRIYHSGLAAKEPEAHCPHAGPGGAGTCGMNCEGFCAIAVDVCTGDNEVFASRTACEDECETFADTETFDQSDTSGDTFACRLYHLTVAATNPETHCPHIVADSPVCVP